MLASGTLLQNRYRIVQPLGSGGQGAVYLAQHLGLNTYVAVKEGFSNDPTTNAQFQTEANLLARLSHPNLPRVTDFFIEPNGARFLVMEYVQGENLEKIVESRGTPIPESEALTWFRQIFDAVRYLHKSQVIHRDIKPQNMIITPQHRAVLVDFGIAKVMASGVTGQSIRFGTPGYAPPEQYSGGTDERSDIYSLGATLYFALTGQTPIEAPMRASGLKLRTPRQVNVAISANVEDAIVTAMSLDAAQRFTSVNSMEQRMSTPQSTLPPFGSRSSASSNRRLVVGSGIAIALLLALCGVGANQFFAGGASVAPTTIPSSPPTVPLGSPTISPTSVPIAALPTLPTTIPTRQSPTGLATTNSLPTATGLSNATPLPTFCNRGGLAGQIFNDLNGSGIRESNEAGLSGVVVNLSTQANSIISVTATDTFGNYRFADIPLGSYNVAVNVQPGWFATTSATIPGLIDDCGILPGFNFGFGQAPPSVSQNTPPAQPTGIVTISTSVAELAYAALLAPEEGLEIFLMPDSKTTPKQLTSRRGEDTDPNISPDGELIVFESDQAGDRHIFTVRADGTGLKQISFGPGQDRQPVFSPDGRRVVFTSNREGERYRLYSTSLDGGDTRFLGGTNDCNFFPSFSPDGTRLVFTSEVCGSAESNIFVMNADGSNIQQISTGGNEDGSPCMMTDSRIVFHSKRSGKLAIYRINQDGSGLEQLSFNPEGLDDLDPACSAMNTIAFARVVSEKGSLTPKIHFLDLETNEITRLQGSDNLGELYPSFKR